MLKFIFSAIYNSQKGSQYEGNENATLRYLFFSVACTVIACLILWGHIFSIYPSNRVLNVSILVTAMAGFSVDSWAYIRYIRHNQYKSFVNEAKYNSKFAIIVAQIVRKVPVVILIIYAFYYSFTYYSN